ncbi:hypothetical protein OQJ18_10255 [Fluoribacter dumoffii]|uniref:Uncharacterized protein n=1 Tax=Fluoribacter dumoffii TaxID=463 RepID=A0A377G787_9GAMM|nr:hypothetical protein [Fluoribacter dumoffii]KTC92399.1 hypothetical protein Ldum_0205 [Fluoribacter dumoffii NY 23]MCW8386976.1 hypothetical protein [Fluoribacter dumoffii]MCW8417521.1 hypothetical protein [Fluoribacter dumoffii]MCW8454637.1 hypothetical protein [Fluoribacter dumoffii]MCW8461286.1 hypothetical protein [Fluoribacter dumoffii]
MQKKYDSNTIGTSAKPKKSVSWNDNKQEGKIDSEFLDIGEGASPTKQILEQEITDLQKMGYSEIEATSMVGKAQTPRGEVIITKPIFYDSREKIAERKFSQAQVPDAKNPDPGSTRINQFSFFSAASIGMGVALAVAATVGFAAFKN